MRDHPKRQGPIRARRTPGRAAGLGVLVALLASLMGAGASAQPTANDRAIASVSVSKVAALTGPQAPADMRTPDVCGTDLGIPAELDGRVYFAFGDTFGFQGSRCSDGPGGPNWRSNVLAATTDLDAQDGVELDWWYASFRGDAIAVTQGAHVAPFAGAGSEQTRIPTAMVAVGERLYMHYMSVHGFAAQGGVWLCNYSRFMYSDSAGESWRQADVNFGAHGDAFNMLALSAQAGAGNEDGAYVYAVGTPCGRFGGARVARVPADQVLVTSAWQYFTGSGWSPARSAAVEVVLPPVGEGSLMWNAGLQRWLFAYLNEASAALELREAPAPWGPWSAPHTLATAAEYPSLYGAYMSPAYLSDDGLTFYFFMSQFGPYDTFVMRAELQPTERE